MLRDHARPHYSRADSGRMNRRDLLWYLLVGGSGFALFGIVYKDEAVDFARGAIARVKADIEGMHAGIGEDRFNKLECMYEWRKIEYSTSLVDGKRWKRETSTWEWIANNIPPELGESPEHRRNIIGEYNRYKDPEFDFSRIPEGQELWVPVARKKPAPEQKQ